MITLGEEKIVVHQIPRIMKFAAEDIMASHGWGRGWYKVVTFAIGTGEPVDYRDTNNYIASSMEKYPTGSLDSHVSIRLKVPRTL